MLFSVSWAQERWQRKYVHGTVRQSAVRRILILWNIFLLPNANMQVLKEVPILLQQYVSSKMAMDAWWEWYSLMKNANNSSKAAHYHVWDRGCVCFPKREEKPSIPAPYSYLPRFRQERQMTEWPIIRTRLPTFKFLDKANASNLEKMHLGFSFFV